jgi:DNA polymerase-3 subunit delta'
MTYSKSIYPWQNALWHHLSQNHSKRHHALLMYGRAGIGKYDFALNFSQFLLCANKSESGRPCQQCSSCHWFQDESHPDFRLITPEQNENTENEPTSVKKTKKKTQISIAQIRDLNDFLSLSSHQNDGLRIVMLHPAEALNTASANALLKMLEEPMPQVMFILITHQLQQLLPTIISRCQKVKMPYPSDVDALAWLNASGVKQAEAQLAYMEGSPLKVLNEQADYDALKKIWSQLALGPRLDPQPAAATFTASSVEIGITALQKWIFDLIAVRFCSQVRYHLQHINTLQGLAEKVNLAKLFELQRKTEALRKLVAHPLNHELQMESLLVDYTKLFKR